MTGSCGTGGRLKESSSKDRRLPGHDGCRIGHVGTGKDRLQDGTDDRLDRCMTREIRKEWILNRKGKKDSVDDEFKTRCKQETKERTDACEFGIG